jgi:hypothetical protein
MNKPCTIEVPPPRVVDTFIGPGNVACTTPAAATDPMICEMKINAARVHPTAPIKAIPKVTAGLNRPPDTRKNTHALTARLNPKPNAMYVSALALGTWVNPPLESSPPADDALATWVAAKAKKRNKKVPTNLIGGSLVLYRCSGFKQPCTNSPIIATR